MACPSIGLPLIVAIFYVVVFNIPFFDIVKRGIDKQAEVNYLFAATIPVFLVLALSLVFSLFSVKYLLKPFFILLTLLSSCVSLPCLFSQMTREEYDPWRAYPRGWHSGG